MKPDPKKIWEVRDEIPDEAEGIEAETAAETAEPVVDTKEGKHYPDLCLVGKR
jgi:hypothetical protein